MAARATKLSRDAIVNAALAFLDREGWDALTINALATQLGTKGPSLYNHVQSLEDLRRTVRMRVIRDIIGMLNAVGDGRTRDDAVVTICCVRWCRLVMSWKYELRRGRSDLALPT